MNRTSLRRVALPGVAVIALGLSVSACGASNESNGGNNNNSSGGLSGTLNGSGSSAQQAAQAAWTADFQKSNSGVTINYNPIGSGGGVDAFTQGGVDFAGSDAALDPTQGQVAAATKRCGGNVIEVPDYVSPVALVFNIPGVTKLNLDASTIAKIFSGKITKWNDPTITALNSGTKLPALAITPVHRSDSSGTTNNFTDYLHQAAPSDWASSANDVWPLKSGEGANGTSGVIAAVQKGKGAIGYADNSQAGSLDKASVKVGSAYVMPTAATAAKDLALSKVASGRGAGDLAMQIARTSSNTGAYPITLVSYLIACPTYSGAKAELVQKYLSYVVSNAGQQSAAKTAGSTPLPSALEQKAAALIGGIKKG